MKGLILAGGLATRLRPLTWVTNKHLLPVYNKPMIYYPLESLVKAGIKEILISSSPDHAGQFTNLLKGGDQFGVKLYYSVQENPKGGIAHAISLAEEFTKGEKIAVILGDNIFNYNLKPTVEKFNKKDKGAMVFGIKMPEMESKHYGVIEMDKTGKVVSIEEKPEKPKSDYCVTGLYIYDSQVVEVAKSLKPSKRGELEITDINNYYLKKGQLEVAMVKGEWVDAGTFDSLLYAQSLAKEKLQDKLII